jgi:hypothetical protein
MTDARIPDRWLTDRRILRLSDAGHRLFVNALVWSVSNKTDGVLEPDDLPIIPHYRAGLEDKLVDAGLWLNHRSGWLIADFIETQTTKAEHEVLAYARFKSRERQALFKNPKLRKEIRDRDGDLCRYCGRTVDWSDRRSGKGGTYDHVIPDGGSTLENLVVADRRCNAQKGRRTPEQAGMPLLPPPGSGSNSGSNSGSSNAQKGRRTPEQAGMPLLPPPGSGSNSGSNSGSKSTSGNTTNGQVKGSGSSSRSNSGSKSSSSSALITTQDRTGQDSPVLSRPKEISSSSNSDFRSSSTFSEAPLLRESGTSPGDGPAEKTGPTDGMGRPAMSFTVLAGGKDQALEPPPVDRHIPPAAGMLVRRVFQGSPRALLEKLIVHVGQGLNDGADEAASEEALSRMKTRLAAGEDLYPGNYPHILNQILSARTITPEQRRNGRRPTPKESKLANIDALRDNPRLTPRTPLIPANRKEIPQ